MDWTQNRSERNTTLTRQTRSNHKNRNTKKRKRTKIFLESKTISVKVYRKPFSTNRYTKKTTEETKQVDMDRRTHKSLQQPKKTNNTTTMPSTLQPEERKYPYNRCQY